MLTCSAVPSEAYYLREDEARRLAYYGGDHGGRGVWWISPDNHSGTQTAFGDCPNGEPIDDEVFIRLCAGVAFDGQTVKRAGLIRRPGYDLTFSMPKPVSVLALLSSDATAIVILAAHDRAVRRTLTFIHEHGLIETRAGKAGIERTAAKAYVAAVFRHITSRHGDPQVHSHCVMPNTAINADGSIGAIDNKKLLDFQRLVGAIYSAELAAEMRGLGYAIEASEKSFNIVGFPEPASEIFSKGRNNLEQFAQRAGFDPSVDRKKAQQAHLSIRPSKTPDRHPTEMRLGWLSELSSAGLDPVDFPQPLNKISAGIDMHIGLEAAIASAFENDAVLTQPMLFARLAEFMQWFCDADQIEDALKHLVPLLVSDMTPDERRPAKKMYSTLEFLALEREIIAGCKGGIAVRTYFDEASIETAIDARPLLSEEQKDAARHAMNGDQISIVEGAAGAGKSFMLGAVSSAALTAGLQVIVTAPAWSATNVLAKDTEAPVGSKRALAGLLNDIENGKIELGDRTVVLADEAGMIGTRDMSRLIRAMRASGCKLILSGDTKQLKPVAAGSPLLFMARAIGSSRINEIRRQQSGWQRAASMSFARGCVDDGLRDYDFRGHIAWSASRDSTIQSLADRYVADMMFDRSQNPSGHLPTALAITSRNADVHELNREIRLRLKGIGEVGDTDTVVDILLRQKGKKATSGKLTLSPGDRIILGETIVLPARTIRNADVVTIVSLKPDGRLTLQFADDGQQLLVKLSDLIGFRDKKEPRLPLLRHAYCATVHFCQGMTVDRAYVASLHGMDREATYVSMTRHRHSVHLFVDTSRLRSTRSEWPVEQLNKADALQQKKAAYFRESLRGSVKLNATDFVQDLDEWMAPRAPLLTAGLRQHEVARANTLRRMERRTRQSLGEAARLDTPVTVSGMPNALYRRLGHLKNADQGPMTTCSWEAVVGWLRHVAQAIRDWTKMVHSSKSNGNLTAQTAPFEIRKLEEIISNDTIQNDDFAFHALNISE